MCDVNSNVEVDNCVDINEENIEYKVEDHEPVMRVLTGTVTQNESHYYSNTIDIALLNMKHRQLICSKSKTFKSLYSSKLFLFQLIQNTNSNIQSHRSLLILPKRSALNYVAKKITMDLNVEKSKEETLFFDLVNRDGSLIYNDSPYIVRLLYLLPHSTPNQFYFTFELCIANLENYFQMNKMSLEYLAKKFYGGEQITRLVIDHFKLEYNTNVTRILLIYAFEIMNALHYLATRNIVHGNLCSRSVLIDERGHLKLSDLGLNDRFRWEERIANDSLSIRNKMEWGKDSFGVFNLYYADAEMILTEKDASAVTEWLSNNEFQSVLCLVRKIEYQPPCFMSDAYAAAILIQELFMGGFSVTNAILLNKCLKDKYKLTDLSDELAHKIWTVLLIYHSDIHDNLLNGLLLSSDLVCQVHKLLFGCFRARNERFSEFTSEKIIMDNQRSVKFNCINIDLLEKMSIFKTNNIKVENVRSCYIDVNFTKHLIKRDSDKINVDDGCLLTSDNESKSHFKMILASKWSNVFEYS